jgi:drug/metabolite transporter (DMT)-like permease
VTALRRRPAALVAVALAIVYVVWGSTYLGMFVAIRTLPPLVMSSVRFFVAGALLFGWAYARGARPTRRQWRDAFVAGALLLFLGNAGIAWAEQRVDTGVAALLVAAMPLWLAALDRLLFARSLTRLQGLGLLLGLVGVAVLVDPSGSGIDLVGAGACLAACFAWAAGSLYARGADQPPEPLAAAATQMLAASLLLAVGAVATGEARQFDPGAVSGESLLALAYLISIGSIVTFSAYGWLLRNAPTPLVSTYAFVNPAVAVALGALFLDEPLGWRMLVAGAAIVVSVALTVLGRPRTSVGAEQSTRTPVATRVGRYAEPREELRPPQPEAAAGRASSWRGRARRLVLDARS